MMDNRGWRYYMQPFDDCGDIIITAEYAGYGSTRRISGHCITSARSLRAVMQSAFNCLASQFAKYGFRHDEDEFALVAKRFAMKLQEGETTDHTNSAGLAIDIAAECPYTLPDELAKSARTWGQVLGDFLVSWRKSGKGNDD